MRITFITSSMGAGGAQRVMSTMANYWAAKAREVTIITLDLKTTDFYELHTQVKRIALGLMGTSVNLLEAVRNNLYRLKHLRRVILASRPDVIISFEDKTNVLTLLAMLGLSTPVVISERTDPEYHDIGFFWGGLRRLFYPRANAVVVQSVRVKEWTQRFVRKRPVVTIPNPVEPPVLNSGSVAYPLRGGHVIVAMGRLSQEKGFDQLLRAFAQCSSIHPEWSLLILGEGDQRGRLEELVSELHITDRAILPGRIKEPAAILRRADLFVMSSHYEGFPNALLEAMTCGLPVISTDCPSGPREIIRNGVDGVLVPVEDTGALAAAMDCLMADETLRKSLAARAPEVIERFGLEKVMGMWEALLSQVMLSPQSEHQ